MKKLMLMVALFTVIIGCGNVEEDIINNNPIIPEPPIIVPEPVTEQKIQFCVLTSDTLKFYDGVELKDWKSGTIRKAGNKLFTVDDILYELGEHGETLSTRQLPAIAQQCVKIGNDIWTFENIDPLTAYNLGALYKDYTITYKNNEEQGEVWYLNQYKAVELKKDNSDNIFIIGLTGPYISVNNNLENIRTIIQNGFTIYDFNGLEVKLEYNDNTYIETFTTNYMYSANQWQKSGDIWYSQNGYEWSMENGLIENANILWNWTFYPYPIQEVYNEAPFIISAGTRIENSETVLYYIECNTGWLYKYIPSTDVIILKAKLYFTDGMRQTGIEFSKNLKPKLIGDNLFFVDQGSIYKYDLNTDLVSIFYAGHGEILEF